MLKGCGKGEEAFFGSAGKNLSEQGRFVRLRNALKEDELDVKSNVQNLHIAGSDKPVNLYDLNVIISVGYRVISPRSLPPMGNEDS
jgi:hypothetical protein